MRRLLLAVVLAAVGCQSSGNYVYPPGQVPGASTPSGRSHQKMPQPKAGDAASDAVDVNVHV